MDSEIEGGANLGQKTSLGPTGSEARESESVADLSHSSSPSPVLTEPVGRNSIFGQLVTSDADINGLVAYSIYKQNKLDWLAAFEAAKKRLPNEAELSSYIIGESTPRRLATYRHLADSTLSGDQLKSSDAGFVRRGVRPPLLTPSSLAIGAIVIVLGAIGFWLAAHFAFTAR